jgi:hypothetical protein
MINHVTLAQLLADPKKETQTRIKNLMSAREFVLNHRHNAKQFVTYKPGSGYSVGIYDVPLALDARSLVVNTRKAPAPQLLGNVSRCNCDCFEVAFAEKAWISAANHIYKLL